MRKKRKNMSRLVTKEGLEKLQNEFEDRTTKIRQEIANAIKEAKEQGDLSENAEYSAAKERQSENEARISQLEIMIKESQVVERDADDASAQIGSKVTVEANGQEYVFEIVGSNEANPSERKISNESPIGKALIGASEGDAVDVETPGGTVQYKVVSIG
ncbi:MAG: transcription elongation factor GreA [Candidatus Moraniibacteriota bacterium]|nr:MAG: transcription elongation factor GreA [Candidatus Moranbacteria bacterium]